MNDQPENNFVRKWRVSVKEAGMRLLAFLRKKNLNAPSMKSLKRALDGKCCTINGRIETFSSHLLKTNDLVVLHNPLLKRTEKFHLPILYEDEDLLIVDKPAGLTCENRIFAPLLRKNRAQLIHRLDKETSGVLMLGKNKEIIELMIELFQDKAVHKTYLALVDGAILLENGKIENSLRKKISSTSGQAFYEVTKGKGLKAITQWKCLDKTKEASLLLCEPITGRTHQLRVHLQWLGHPILGDVHYVRRFRCFLRPQRHLLHALAIAFVHPKTHQPIKVEAPIPADFQEALQKLRLSLKT
jgi:23S rRNA pseudouridine955/2504/2580 synthase